MSVSLLAQLDELPAEYIITGAVVIGLLLLIGSLRFFRRRRRIPLPPPIDLTIDLAELGDAGPPTGNRSLELYNLPVRLAAIIIAPAGRGAQLPTGTPPAALADEIVPGLSDVVDAHKTRIYEWPAQLSTHGFSHTLFSNISLPGDRGKGTPWSVIAGRVEAGQQTFLAGVIVRAEAANSLGQFVLDRPGQWLDLLRVRRNG
jgi:hypothetical protein